MFSHNLTLSNNQYIQLKHKVLRTLILSREFFKRFLKFYSFITLIVLFDIHRNESSIFKKKLINLLVSHMVITNLFEMDENLSIEKLTLHMESLFKEFLCKLQKIFFKFKILMRNIFENAKRKGELIYVIILNIIESLKSVIFGNNILKHYFVLSCKKFPIVRSILIYLFPITISFLKLIGAFNYPT